MNGAVKVFLIRLLSPVSPKGSYAPGEDAPSAKEIPDVLKDFLMIAIFLTSEGRATFAKWFRVDSHALLFRLAFDGFAVLLFAWVRVNMKDSDGKMVFANPPAQRFLALIFLIASVLFIFRDASEPPTVVEPETLEVLQVSGNQWKETAIAPEEKTFEYNLTVNSKPGKWKSVEVVIVCDHGFEFDLVQPDWKNSKTNPIPVTEKPVEYSATQFDRSSWRFPDYHENRHWNLIAKVKRTDAKIAWPKAAPISGAMHLLKEKDNL